MKDRANKILLLLILLLPLRAMASHIVGGEVTYKYVGSGGGANNYEIHLVIYEDCKNGSPDAIDADNPAFLAAYDAGTLQMRGLDTNINFTESLLVPVNFSNSCVSNIPSVCLLRKTFIKTFALPVNANGYIISYQRCCRNGAIVNIVDPSSQGATYFCQIPKQTVALFNNSAVFKNYPPQIICLHNPLNYDHSATDADGDSLSYEFGNCNIGADGTDVKPIPGPPPYDSVTWIFPFSPHHPFSGSPQIQIDPVTGIITGTPNLLGRFLVAVLCHEWRDGKLINTMKREFQFVVTDCSKKVVACMPQYSADANTYIVQCSGFTVHFSNCSSGGFAYHWDFGVEGISSDTSDEAEPTYTYADTGIYTVKLLLNPGSTCPDSISKLVKIFPYFRSGFSDSGMFCPGSAISFTDKSTSTIKPITNWNWNFGDGTTSAAQDNTHVYTHGGTYNVMLISENVKSCIDTSVVQVYIESFKPSAGDDTIIVKGESIQFNATGGSQYLWTPSLYLNDTTISNPLGYYPDTGVFYYTLNVESENGCKGSDTIKVWVVNQAEFFIPTGFSPNGDGNNDIFRPIAVGYRSIKYFKVFDRWGEMVYYGQNLLEGWDGTYNHKKAELGTYFWEINYTDRFGKESFMKGDVTLIR